VVFGNKLVIRKRTKVKIWKFWLSKNYFKSLLCKNTNSDSNHNSWFCYVVINTRTSVQRPASVQSRLFNAGGGLCRKYMENSSAVIKVPPLSAV
jgi:hypothetical protein